MGFFLTIVIVQKHFSLKLIRMQDGSVLHANNNIHISLHLKTYIKSKY